MEECLQEFTAKSNNTGPSQEGLEEQLGDTSNQRSHGAGRDLKILKVTLRDVLKQHLNMVFICNSLPSAVRETLAVAAFAKQLFTFKTNPVRTYFDPAVASEVARLEIEQLKSQLEKELEEKTAAVVLVRDQLAVIAAVNETDLSAKEYQNAVSVEGYVGSERPPSLASRVSISFKNIENEFEKMRQEAKIWREEEDIFDKLTSEVADLSRKNKQLDENQKNLKEQLAECKSTATSQQETVDHLRKSEAQLQSDLSCERAKNELLTSSNVQLQQQLAEQRKFLHFVKNLGAEATRRDDEVHAVLKSSIGLGTSCGTNPERSFKRPLSAKEVQPVGDHELYRPLVIAVESAQSSYEAAVPEKKAKVSPH